jgi:hypothetical protein
MAFYFFYFSVITSNFVPFIGECLNNTNSLHRFFNDNWLSATYLSLLKIFEWTDQKTAATATNGLTVTLIKLVWYFRLLIVPLHPQLKLAV